MSPTGIYIIVGLGCFIAGIIADELVLGREVSKLKTALFSDFSSIKAHVTATITATETSIKNEIAKIEKAV